MFKKIVVPIDVEYPRTSKAVYHKAAEIAKLSNAEIRLVVVLPGFGMPIVASYITEEIKKQLAQDFKTELKNFIKEYCDENVSYEIVIGKNGESIMKAAQDWGADLIIVYHHHRGKINKAFSSLYGQRIYEKANCSVLKLRNVLSTP